MFGANVKGKTTAESSKGQLLLDLRQTEVGEFLPGFYKNLFSLQENLRIKKTRPIGLRGVFRFEKHTEKGKRIRNLAALTHLFILRYEKQS